MPTFADALKREISRVARKEIKTDMSLLRRAVATQRGEIAALKREVKKLQSENRALAKAQKRIAGVSARQGATSSESLTSTGSAAGRARRGRKPVYSADGLKAARAKLGLTQAQLATLLEVSSLTVSKWERGSVPRAKQQEKIFALRALGKRAAGRILQERA